jgi:hypothetical protein
MEIVNNTFEQLNNRLGITKYDYSKEWLKKSKGYLAHLQSSKSSASLDALVALYGTAIQQRRMWEQSGANRSGSEKALYNEHTDYFRNIENAAHNEIKQQALTM